MIEKKNTDKFPKSIISNIRFGCCLKGSVLKKHLLFLGVLVIVAVILGYFFRDRFLAAVVNNKPIFRYKLSQMLIESSGKEALENLIVEGLIKKAIEENNVTVGKEEIDSEINTISQQFGAESKFEEVLKAQGMTLEDFRSQIETRLQVYKIIGKDIVVSDDEVTQFLKDNGETLTATSEAERKTQATEALREQKISGKIQPWIDSLLAKAKITRFLK